MTYFRVGQLESSNPPQRPFVEFSPHQDRASLMSVGGRHSQTRSRSTKRKGRRRKSRGVSKIRIVKGKVALRIGGFPGVQRVGASQLVRFVPLNKLRAAAKRVLGSPPRRSTKKRAGRKGRKRQKQRAGRHH